MNRVSVDVPGLAHGDLPIPAACRIGPFIATGGIRGIDPVSQMMPADPQREADQMFDNLAAILLAAGTTTEAILKLTIWINNPAHRPMVNPGWVKLFPDAQSRPARHILVHDLPIGMTFQCQALAVAQQL